MRPELQRLVDELTEVRASIAAVQDMEKLATNGWTVAGVLDHLIKVHEALIPASKPPSTPHPNSKAKRP